VDTTSLICFHFVNFYKDGRVLWKQERVCVFLICQLLVFWLKFCLNDFEKVYPAVSIAARSKVYVVFDSSDTGIVG
jgi:hypothetical protein